MSPHEKYFVAKSLEKTSIPSAIHSICEAVRLLYPRSLKSIEKNIGNHELDKLLLKCSPDKDVAAETKGKGSLQTKCVSELQTRRMMFKHFSISQLSYNMGKCTGMYHQYLETCLKCSFLTDLLR